MENNKLEHLYKFSDKDNYYNAEIIFGNHLTDLKKRINFSKIAIIDFEAISEFLNKKGPDDKKDFFVKVTPFIGIPISASLFLGDKENNEVFHFEILSKISYKKGPKIYKKELNSMLKEMIEKIPKDYKIIVWGKEFEERIFSLIIDQNKNDIIRKKQFIDVLDLQKVFSKKINTSDDNPNINFNVNFSNKKNSRINKNKIKKELEDLSSFSYDGVSLEEFNKEINEIPPKPPMRAHRSLDFIKTIVEMININNYELDMRSFKHDRSLFIKINNYFNNGNVKQSFLDELKKYNNEDVEGIFLILEWLKKELNIY